MRNPADFISPFLPPESPLGRFYDPQQEPRAAAGVRMLTANAAFVTCCCEVQHEGTLGLGDAGPLRPSNEGLEANDASLEEGEEVKAPFTGGGKAQVLKFRLSRATLYKAANVCLTKVDHDVLIPACSQTSTTFGTRCCSLGSGQQRARLC